MEKIGKKFLPIGTVVMLKGGTKRVMITGFCSIEGNNMNKMWDYSGCMYPEGFLSSKQTCLFNHEQILMNAEYFGLSWESEDIEISSQLQFPIKLKFSQCTSNDQNYLFELQIDDEMQYDIITEYTENYKNIIRTIKILINSDNISISKIITTLAYITKTEQNHITIVQ